MRHVGQIPKNIVKKRAIVLAVFVVLFFLTLSARLFYLQIHLGEYYKEVADSQYEFYQKLKPNRGEIKITDKDSKTPFVVATNIKRPLIYLVPKDVKDSSSVSKNLSEILGVGLEEVEGKLKGTSRSYVPVKKAISEEQLAKIQELKMSGVGVDYEFSRLYPENNLLSQVLGFVGYKGNDRVGLYGLERNFNDVLTGEEGVIRQEKASGGVWIFGGKREVQKAKDGDTLILTIDRNIQFKAESILEDAVVKNEADSGSIIVMDPKTGGVMAMANYPDFNPNEYNKVEDISVFSNRATQSAYEPGSVFKAFTMAAALNEEKITPETTYVDTGKVVVDNFTIMNSDKKAHGKQTMNQALQESLNTAVIFAKDQIGNEVFLKYIKAFGFGEPTQIDLPEAKGNLDNLKGNIRVNYHTASFGQGILVTPIQLVQAYGALANNGVMMMPYVVQTRIDYEGKPHPTSPVAVRRVISEKVSKSVTAMLVNVVEKGHGKKAGVSGYYMAGKTGTAQVAKINGKGYEENNNIGSFAGYGPVEDPRFVILVRVNHPRNVKYAETTAAPAFGEMAQFLVNYLNIPPTRK